MTPACDPPVPALSVVPPFIDSPASRLEVPLGPLDVSGTGRRPTRENPPWVDTTTHTWSLTKKVAVEGDVRWHKKFKASRQATQEVLVGNGLPARSGHFPVSPSDPARA